MDRFAEAVDGTAHGDEGDGSGTEMAMLVFLEISALFKALPWKAFSI